MNRTNQFGWMLRLAGLLFITILIITSITPNRAQAQSSDDSWAAPQNLSHSGAATNPSIVIDSGGILHAVWQDEFSHYVYSEMVNGQWSDPERTSLDLIFDRPSSQVASRQTQELIYTGPNPLFIAGPGLYTYAVWLTPQGSLFVSRVPNYDFKNSGSWFYAQPVSAAVVSFAAAVDARGELHIAYMRTVDATSNPAGIYYIRTTGNGSSLGGLTRLYESPYFRALERGGANLSVSAAGTIDAPLILVAWDNRPRKELLLAKSMDGGQNWGPLKQVAIPDPSVGEEGPFNIRVSARENNIVLVWQSGQPGSVCSQYYGSSNDAGTTWDGPQLMFEDQLGCAQSNEFVPALTNNPKSLSFLLTDIRGQIYLTAWDGRQWSKPELQSMLSGFEDPEIYTQVSFSCHEAALSGERLYIIGCDQGSGRDIWVTSRDIKKAATWFSPQAWSQFLPVSSNDLKISDIELVATGDGLVHAFASQQSDPSIYYTRLDGMTWSRFSPVMQVPDGEASWPAIATGPGNELFLIARSKTGSLYFSRAKSSEAYSSSGWSSPVRLKITHDGRVSPADVVWDEAGTLYVAYSVPVNDERGVYLIQSQDQGKTWSEPYQVFDGMAAGFEIVGSPSLVVSANRKIYLLWKQLSIQADGISQPLSLYFAHSDDAGQSFSVAERLIQAPVSWREMSVDMHGNLHVFWQRIDDLKSLWEQISTDGGRSWQSPMQFPSEEGAADVSVDTSGQVHLVESGQSILNHWMWDGSRWQAESSALRSSSSEGDSPAELLASSVNGNGKMVIVMAAPSGEGGANQMRLFFAMRTVELQPTKVTLQETPDAPILLPVSTPTMPAPTPASVSAIIQSPDGQTDTRDPISGIAVVLLPVSLLLISVLGIVYFKAVRGRSR